MEAQVPSNQNPVNSNPSPKIQEVSSTGAASTLPQSKTSGSDKKTPRIVYVLLVLLGVVILAASVVGAYWWMNKDTEDTNGPKNGQESQEEDCVGEGEILQMWDEKVCCAGLRAETFCVLASDTEGGCACPTDGSKICIDCGDGDCGLGEDWCTCSEDCDEPESEGTGGDSDGDGPENGVTESWESYTNEEMGFKVRHPIDVVVMERYHDDLGKINCVDIGPVDGEQKAYIAIGYDPSEGYPNGCFRSGVGAGEHQVDDFLLKIGDEMISGI